MLFLVKVISRHMKIDGRGNCQKGWSVLEENLIILKIFEMVLEVRRGFLRKTDKACLGAELSIKT